MKAFSSIVAIFAGIILLQTLYFKFTGAPESVWIFSQLGVEPWGRILSGVLELMVTGLLFYPPTRVYGAIGGLSIMMGAILSHLFILGVEIQGDGGLLFILAIIETALCLYLIFFERMKLKKMVGLLFVIFSMNVFATPPINTYGEGGGLFSDPPRTEIAIKGYDSVAYFLENKAVLGTSKFSYSWKGANWKFSSEANLNKFKENPEKWAPQYGGYCSFGVSKGYLVKIDPEQFKVIGEKLYLNYDESVHKKWLKETGKFIKISDQKFNQLILE